MDLHTFLRAYERCTTHGWLECDEALLLVATAERTRGRLVEVGCYQGRSAMLLAQLGRPLRCIDPWDDHFSTDLTGQQIYDKFNANLAGLVTLGALWDMRLIDVVRRRVEEVDPSPAGFVYLDGDHTYEGTKAQIKFARGCDPQSIAIHDVTEGNDVWRAAIECLGPFHERQRRLAVWHSNDDNGWSKHGR